MLGYIAIGMWNVVKDIMNVDGFGSSIAEGQCTLFSLKGNVVELIIRLNIHRHRWIEVREAHVQVRFSQVTIHAQIQVH